MAIMPSVCRTPSRLCAPQHPFRAPERRSPADFTAPAPPAQMPKTLCHVCGKTRDQHEKKKFCPVEKKAADPRPPQKGKDKGKGKGKDSGRGKKRAGRRGEVPTHMQGHAHSTPGTRDHPDGTSFCWNFHEKDKGCVSGNCQMSHLCPAYKADGRICLAEGPVFEHHRHR